MTTKKPRLAVPVKMADRVWTYRNDQGALVTVPHGQKPPAGTGGKWESRYAAACSWCTWTYGPEITRAAVDEQARWHREQHRREARA